jgi:hypothetical protein
MKERKKRKKKIKRNKKRRKTKSSPYPRLSFIFLLVLPPSDLPLLRRTDGRLIFVVLIFVESGKAR